MCTDFIYYYGSFENETKRNTVPHNINKTKRNETKYIGPFRFVSPEKMRNLGAAKRNTCPVHERPARTDSKEHSKNRPQCVSGGVFSTSIIIQVLFCMLLHVLQFCACFYVRRVLERMARAMRGLAVRFVSLGASAETGPALLASYCMCGNSRPYVLNGRLIELRTLSRACF